MTKTVTFKVGMTCGGCQGAVTRILVKIEGVQEVNANLDSKIVTVVCSESTSSDDLLQALKKWASSSGKMVELVA